ncbi:uncharacterized protein ATC70_006393 [Mucor velutinosus]|uniref:COX assembly mitochondrial protein n=1 Tax=Mucor velutinosus TaxID=708070 RepID=A0AAN7D962_9FUNG|nr:hypothetical protein ATC70_006393 [Mucor velutinosus]
MSNNKEQGSARDYIKSYVKESNTEDYLQQEQPRYDPTKPIQSPQPTPVEQEPLPEPVQTSEHYKVHLPTQNPIPSNENTEPRAEQQQQPPQPVWAARDFKEQRSEIHETSLTVCADLHENLMTCFQHGSWWDKAKMCEEQKQKFWSCYNAQKKFLKEVNYKGPINTEKEDNEILLRAYKLRDKIDQQQQEKKAEK